MYKLINRLEDLCLDTDVENEVFDIILDAYLKGYYDCYEDKEVKSNNG